MKNKVMIFMIIMVGICLIARSVSAIPGIRVIYDEQELPGSVWQYDFVFINDSDSGEEIDEVTLYLPQTLLQVPENIPVGWSTDQIYDGDLDVYYPVIHPTDPQYNIKQGKSLGLYSFTVPSQLISISFDARFYDPASPSCADPVDCTIYGLYAEFGDITCTDNDSDGYGNPGEVVCPNGSAEDCNDSDAAINPGAENPGAGTCNDSADNDCDGLIDANDPNCQPDLRVTFVNNPPSSRKRGTKFSVKENVQNAGPGDAVPYKVSYFLSKDKIKGKGDRALKGRRSVTAVSALQAGGVSVGTSKNVTIPATTSTGYYYVITCADIPNSNNETSETNNCRASTKKIKVLP